MTSIIPYITFREPDDSGRLCYCILQKEFPHYVCLLVAAPMEKSLCNSPIAGYRLWVSFSGTIRGNIIPSYKDIIPELSRVCFDMGNWFLNNRIKQEQKKYSKFLV